MKNIIYGFTTSSAARKLSVSCRTILAYCKAGLLHPKRAASGWRYFDPREVALLAAERRAVIRRGGRS